MAKNSASVQQHLLIDEIRDGVVIMKDSSLRSVVLVSSINFALKGEDEKNAIIASFQQFVNSITFPVQIVVRSKNLNLDDYLTKLNELRAAQKNSLLREQTGDYIEFISRMLDVVNIMEKNFFVVVPYYPSGLKKVGYMDEIVSKIKPKAGQITAKKSEFDNNKTQLLQRAENVIAGISGVGLRAVALNTQELIELYYTIYNPSTEHYQKLTDISQFSAPIVSGEELPQPGGNDV